MKKERVFYLVSTGVYRGIVVSFLRGEHDDKMYISRDCVRKALQYTDIGQLSKTQSRYPELFASEYVSEYVMVSGNQKTAGRGLYTIRGIVEICAHTQRFRSADLFLDFLQKQLAELGVSESTLILPGSDPISVYEKTEREILIQISSQLATMEKLLEKLTEYIIMKGEET